MYVNITGLGRKRYKLIYWYGVGYGKDKGIDFWELFDLKKDPTEIHNVYGDIHYKEIQNDLNEQLIQLRKKIGVPE